MAGVRGLRRAVLAAGFPELGIGFVGVSLAFGLTVLTMAYAIGHMSGLPSQSGGHRRPLGRRAFPAGDVICPTSSPRCWAPSRAPASCT